MNCTTFYSNSVTVWPLHSCTLPANVTILITPYDLEQLPIQSLYELLADRIEVIASRKEKKFDEELFSVRKKEIETIQKVIDRKKEKIVN